MKQALSLDSEKIDTQLCLSSILVAKNFILNLR